MENINPTEKEKIQKQALAAIARILKFQRMDGVLTQIQRRKSYFCNEIMIKLKSLSSNIQRLEDVEERTPSEVNSERNVEIRFENDELRLLFKSAVDLDILHEVKDFNEIFPKNPPQNPPTPRIPLLPRRK